MTFEEWFNRTPYLNDNLKSEIIIFSRAYSMAAWGYQQAIIDDLKDQLENEKQRADEYFDKWDNLMKESEV